jgi:hypothetical protein
MDFNSPQIPAIPCHVIARMIREKVGLGIYAPAMAKTLAVYESCTGENCRGNGLLGVSMRLADAERADAILALRN